MRATERKLRPQVHCRATLARILVLDRENFKKGNLKSGGSMQKVR